MESGSLLDPNLWVLYQEVHGHDIEYKAKNFWQNILIRQFPWNLNYTVNSEVSPDGDDRTRVDLSIGQIREEHHQTLLFLEAKRTGQGNALIHEAEEQLERGAKKFLEKSGSRLLYGMTTWGTKARCWIFERRSGGSFKKTPFYGKYQENLKDTYIDAHSERAYYISLFFSIVRDEAPPPMPSSLQLPSQAGGSQGGYDYSGYQAGSLQGGYSGAWGEVQFSTYDQY
ncbi:hypothetical protein HIM_10300 [Hirsutella minnesotensis 3608]|uniref:Fungal-type protein kinase domain-containing protein n=1 Tax=Hirsutella minnesotensis 3608 TaxID=1043627 RepID=A0A0F7ZRV9_9HYPO|nr:hypothetical protein HIM_10300 [Hirsutella minnesotensis 3608]